MKKLLLFFVVCIASYNCFATHMMGGQITSRNIGGLTYEVTATIYRDTLGIPISQSNPFDYVEIGGTWSTTKNVPVSPAFVFGNGVEEYKYIDTITFPNSGSFSISFEQCCRNCALLNMTNPCGESFHLSNILLADPTNSSPVFLNPPIPIAQQSQPFIYNPLPFDSDGDSIVWSIDTPLTSAGLYVAGYVVPFADSTMPFTMNPLTGEVSFIPSTIGYFEASFLVSEYRGGVKIGEIRRDMQIIVIASPNNPPTVTSGSNTAPYTGKVFTIQPGSLFSLSVSVYDADMQSVSIVAQGEPLTLAANPAQFVATNGNGTGIGTFTWTPTIAEARLAPYIVSMRVSDYYGGYTFSSDVTYRLGVGNFTAVNDFAKEVVKNIYPNPNDGDFTLELNNDKAEDVVVTISNMIGQQVFEFTHSLNEGLNFVKVRSVNLPKGNYILNVIKQGQVSDSQSFEIKD